MKEREPIPATSNIYLEIDGNHVATPRIKTYGELLQVEIKNELVEKLFPYKPHTPRYAVSINHVPSGYYKVLSSSKLTQTSSTRLTLHRQA